VPSDDFGAALSDMKTLGRMEAIAEAGEDTAVRLATAARHLTAAQANLSRLQKLQRERKSDLRDAVALERDIAQANEVMVEAERQHAGLVSTVARAVIRITLVENHRAPLEANLAGEFLQLRNSLVEGVGAIFSSVSLFLGVLFEFGLPLFFWAACSSFQAVSRGATIGTQSRQFLRPNERVPTASSAMKSKKAGSNRFRPFWYAVHVRQLATVGGESG
jgi:hypothetical protein